MALIESLRKKGYQEGYEVAKKALQGGKSKKDVLNMSVDEKKIAKIIMKDLKVNHDKSVRFACIYSFGFDKGILEAVYE